ncbi:MAG: hypothetical protein KHZ72_02225 [Lachnospiraceae bacterium]|mgnify:CR=1 FL=1|nr:hypothetical protein [Lachnospiraceae bacterium]
MYFQGIAEEVETYMAPSEWSGIFVVQLVGDTLRAPMTEEFAADMMGWDRFCRGN